ncbi:MAG: hypothetical protein ACRYF0_05165 [Janthinobacterium lividum]
MAVIPLKRWNIAPQPDPAAVAGLGQALRVSPVLARLLLQRGIDTPAAAHDFFEPDLAKLASPWLMCDMDRAVARLHRALEAGEKILVLGDYDVDGITSVALVISFLRPWSKASTPPRSRAASSPTSPTGTAKATASRCRPWTMRTSKALAWLLPSTAA